MTVGAADGDPSVFEWLSERFQGGSRVFGNLIKEQHAKMRETDFTGFWPAATTDKGGPAGRMVRRAEWPRHYHAVDCFTCQTMELGDSDPFFRYESWQKRRERPGEHGFAGAG